MKGITRIGDKTTGDGQVLSGSSTVKFKDIGIARLNDPVSCPMEGHGQSYISQGHSTMKDRGIPVAFHDYECSCGCKLISSLNNATTSK